MADLLHDEKAVEAFKDVLVAERSDDVHVATTFDTDDVETIPDSHSQVNLHTHDMSHNAVEHHEEENNVHTQLQETDPHLLQHSELAELNHAPITQITVPTEEGPVDPHQPIAVAASKKRKRLRKPTGIPEEREPGKIYNIDGIPRKWDGKRFRTMCFVMGCIRHASGASFRCIRHGGGNRCQVAGCPKSALGKTGKCGNHGGGIRCVFDGCNSIAVGKSGLCVTHGGGKRCAEFHCNKAARGPTKYCKLHGGT